MSDLDNLFQIQSIDKEAKTFWPNICCKERRDTTLEVCDPIVVKLYHLHYHLVLTIVVIIYMLK